MPFSDSLAIPQLYQAFQVLGGFYGARLSAIERYLRPKTGQRLIDIGCGPGYLARDLPMGIDYIGFDLDQRYIAFAKRRFSDRGQFYCRHFDEEAAKTFGPADIVTMNGVLHHISDAEAASTLASIHEVLRPAGALFTLDGAYIQAQPWFARWMLDHDRGRHVRTPERYQSLLEHTFARVESHVHEDLARVPCTLFIAISRKTPG
jgi:SAM-dependent methyltransferase